jgi:hypothetical protein
MRIKKVNDHIVLDVFIIYQRLYMKKVIDLHMTKKPCKLIWNKL